MLQGAQADSDDREARLPIDAYCVRDCTWICHGLPCSVLPPKHCFEVLSATRPEQHWVQS